MRFIADHHSSVPPLTTPDVQDDRHWRPAGCSGRQAAGTRVFPTAGCGFWSFLPLVDHCALYATLQSSTARLAAVAVCTL